MIPFPLCSVRHHNGHPAAGGAEELSRRRRHARGPVVLRCILGFRQPGGYWRQCEGRLPAAPLLLFIFARICPCELCAVRHLFNCLKVELPLLCSQVMLTVATSDLFTGPTRSAFVVACFRYGLRQKWSHSV